MPDAFPGILKNFIKEVVRNKPENLVEYSRQYFEALHKASHKIDEEDRQRIEMNPKEFYLSHKDNIKDHY